MWTPASFYFRSMPRHNYQGGCRVWKMGSPLKPGEGRLASRPCQTLSLCRNVPTLGTSNKKCDLFKVHLLPTAAVSASKHPRDEAFKMIMRPPLHVCKTQGILSIVSIILILQSLTCLDWKFCETLGPSWAFSGCCTV